MPYRAKDKPSLDITLTDGQQDAFIPSYATLDEIKGCVTMTPQVETKIDNIYITLECIVKTCVERVSTAAATTGRSEGFTPALHLVQPIPETAMPESGKVHPGKTYTFPFEFAVPEELLPSTCEHTIDNDVVRQAHLQLPPTLGDPMSAVWGKTMMDDMAPQGSIVSYSIRVRLISGKDAKTGKHIFIAEASKKIRVIPAVPEHPPLAVLEGKQDDYRLRKEKPLKKGTFQKRIGTLVMESAQPRSLHLPPLRSENPGPVTTMATIRLRFDPASSEAQPPRLGSLVTKLKVATFYASKPMRDIPKRSANFHYSSDNGLYVESIPLSSRCVASATWVKHTPQNLPHPEPTPSRQESIPAGSPVVPASSLATPAPSESYKEGEDYYTAYLKVPITLPGKVEGNTNHKVFVPTFYTCLVARVYALDLTLSCHTPGASVTVPEMHLKLPVQVSAEPNADARPKISQGEAQAIARRECMHPGNIAPPIPAYTEEAQAGVGPSSPEDAGLTPTRENPDDPGLPFRARQSNNEPQVSQALPSPDYNIQTSGRPNVSSR